MSDRAPDAMRLPWVGSSTLALLAACGGGGDSGDASPVSSYDFLAPRSGSQQIYAQTTTDNSNNTVDQTLRHSVTVVDADGSYTFVQDDPTGDSVTVNGTVYSIPTESISISNTGETTAYSYIPAGTTTPVTCVYATEGNTGAYPHALGQAWNFSYTVTCGTSPPTRFTQVGAVAGVESVTVPGGTFTALRLQSTVTTTSATGTLRTASITTWRDAQTSLVVKRTTSLAYSGTPLANGYPVVVTLALESRT